MMNNEMNLINAEEIIEVTPIEELNVICEEVVEKKLNVPAVAAGIAIAGVAGYYAYKKLLKPGFKMLREKLDEVREERLAREQEEAEFTDVDIEQEFRD